MLSRMFEASPCFLLCGAKLWIRGSERLSFKAVEICRLIIELGAMVTH
jgi:hypothetical protein